MTILNDNQTIDLFINAYNKIIKKNHLGRDDIFSFELNTNDNIRIIFHREHPMKNIN